MELGDVQAAMNRSPGAEAARRGWREARSLEALGGRVALGCDPAWSRQGEAVAVMVHRVGEDMQHLFSGPWWHPESNPAGDVRAFLEMLRRQQDRGGGA